MTVSDFLRYFILLALFSTLFFSGSFELTQNLLHGATAIDLATSAVWPIVSIPWLVAYIRSLQARWKGACVLSEDMPVASDETPLPLSNIPNRPTATILFLAFGVPLMSLILTLSTAFWGFEVTGVNPNHYILGMLLMGTGIFIVGLEVLLEFEQVLVRLVERSLGLTGSVLGFVGFLLILVALQEAL